MRACEAALLTATLTGPPPLCRSPRGCRHISVRPHGIRAQRRVRQRPQVRHHGPLDGRPRALGTLTRQSAQFLEAAVVAGLTSLSPGGPRPV